MPLLQISGMVDTVRGACCIVLDTNVLLSGIAYPGSIPGKIISSWQRGGLEVVLSQYILDELQRVLPRLNHRLGWSDHKIREFVESLAFLADLVEPVETLVPLLRDAADQPVLGTFLASNATYLVTGDKDLLALANCYPIITPADFWRTHGD